MYLRNIYKTELLLNLITQFISLISIIYMITFTTDFNYLLRRLRKIKMSLMFINLSKQ